MSHSARAAALHGNGLKVLVVGSGGREHALAWRLAQSPRVAKVYVAPGNGGTASDPRLENVPLSGIDELAEFARREALAFTLVGPETPLAAGIVDTFRARGLKIFGPTQAAAQLESSKEFAKAFMQRHGIPTAGWAAYTDPVLAHADIERRVAQASGAPIVIKADGLAAGKGVVIAQTAAEAHAAIDMMLVGNAMGSAGARVVIEDFIEGEEASFIVMVDGHNVLPLATSQDHKRLLDADMGPNTGGMGAYSPAPVVTTALHERVMREIILPTVRGMAADGIPFTGFLYAGLMIDAAGNPKTLEFNCRMGDPETQPIMARLRSDFASVVEHAIDGSLDQVSLDWDPRVALGVVAAAYGYPDAPRKDDLIHGLDAHADAHGDCLVFHAGTQTHDHAHGALRTSGGRVLCVTALASDIGAARAAAYRRLESLGFDGMQYRRDIGWRALDRSPHA